MVPGSSWTWRISFRGSRAIEVYTQQAKNVEAERQACEIRLRAERKWGALRKTEVIPAHRPAELSDGTTLNPQRSDFVA